MSFAELSFTAPWVLWTALLLPLLWWLLRLIPPAPARRIFPMLPLLRDLPQKAQLAARTPLWLLLLRIILIALIILGLAGPTLHAQRYNQSDMPLILLVDNDWAAAANWSGITSAADNFLDIAAARGQSVALITTTTNTQNLLRTNGITTAVAAKGLLAKLTPNPWPHDMQPVGEVISSLGLAPYAEIIWLHNGFASRDDAAFFEVLQQFDAAKLVTPAAEQLPQIITADLSSSPPIVTVHRAGDDNAAISLTAFDQNGRTLAVQKDTFATHETSHAVTVNIPPESEAELSRLVLDGPAQAGSVWLFDQKARRQTIGLASDNKTVQPLLNPAHYIQKALETAATVKTGTVTELLAQNISVLIAADLFFTPADAGAVNAWLQKGGILIRFASDSLAKNQRQQLLPVVLAPNLRNLDSTLSLHEPLHIAPFAANSILANIAPQSDIAFRQYAVPEPASLANAEIWASLDDGTPLITAKRAGQGWTILVHVRGDAGWSNFPLSETFVTVLNKLVSLGHGGSINDGHKQLTPVAVLNGFGQLERPAPNALPLAETAIDTTAPAADHPPGFYGDANAGHTIKRALNLGTYISDLTYLDKAPPGIQIVTGYVSLQNEIRLAPFIFALAMTLALFDLVLSLWLRGIWRFVVPVLALFLCTVPAQAQTVDKNYAPFMTQLAYVQTGNHAQDKIIADGLNALVGIVNSRTTAQLAPARGVTIGADDLSLYTLLYWHFDGSAPSAPDIQKLSSFIKNDGMLVIERDGQTDLAATGLTPLFPVLSPVNDEHALLRSFYLLNRQAHYNVTLPLWIGRADGALDEASNLIVIDGPLTETWQNYQPRDNDSEGAMRLGINLVMYALTGNYKTDQLQIKAILDRLEGGAP